MTIYYYLVPVTDFCVGDSRSAIGQLKSEHGAVFDCVDAHKRGVIYSTRKKLSDDVVETLGLTPVPAEMCSEGRNNKSHAAA